MNSVRIGDAIALSSECSNYRVVAFMLIGVLIAIMFIMGYAWVRDQT